MTCDATSNYDYGSAIDLNGDGVPEYPVCCHYPPHGPCESVLIGKVGSAWKELMPRRDWLDSLVLVPCSFRWKVNTAATTMFAYHISARPRLLGSAMRAHR